MNVKIVNEALISSEVRLKNGDRIVIINRLDEPIRHATDDMHLNLFRISAGGEVVWRVSDYRPFANSTFTTVYEHEGKILATNFDGVRYELVDLDNGVVRPVILVR